MKWVQEQRKRLAQLRTIHAQFGELVRKERKLLGLATTAMFFEVGFLLLAPWPIKYLFDGLLMPREGALPAFAEGWSQEFFVAVICGSVLAIAALGGFSSYYRQVWAATAGQRIVFKLRKRLYDHLHRLPLSFHRGSRLGDLLTRITGDIPMLRDVLSESAVDLVGRFAVVLVTIVLLFVLDPVLALVAICVLILTGLLSTWFAGRIVKVARKQREKEGILAYTAGETLATVSLVKAYGREDEVARRFGRRNRSSLRQGLKATRYQASLSRWVELIFAAGLAAVLGFGVWRALPGGDLTPGDLLVFVAYIRNLNKPLRRISRTSARIGKAAACAERVVEVMEIPQEGIDDEGRDSAPRLDGGLEWQGVTYTYPGQVQPALADVSLSIAPGERVGLVGRNGAGKSTLMSLVLGFARPDEGFLRFDGVDCRNYTLASVREQVSIALQDTFLFGSTVRDNLLFAAPDRTDEELWAMLDQVGASFVRSSPDGLDAELEEGATNLSGGERRKLVLAGALLRKTPILLLDEPTTFVDAASRDELRARLPDLTEGKTTLVITHDPQLLGWLDRVVYMEEGRVLACDGHPELENQSPAYRALVGSSSGEDIS